ncbi:RagB/SusD family nutrient uptake outer membrane protein [Empedobacter falsenii]|uniref:RagB/SusD family nutrient uptake outer membrane protein n=1 Tax=Empedobacter falsenii TaxID=343874 RepID=A0A3R8ZAU8_9FLAO|nr:RagB/SusD family nutrient uptake outer membrane protein [Empedobacter falsenii]RRT94632.1 RagB/SusD family nutrient uptake outer membrane protein [Empedobacter falsenii]RRT94878.1 RagB/SusD family nutrient uptake outer membrane protein [Empedobacter falsenii]
MKKIVYILASVTFLSLTSCDLGYEPYTSIPEGEIDHIDGSPKNLTLGNYSLMKNWVENWHRITEYPGDNVALSGSTTDNLMNNYNYQRIVNNSRVNNYWAYSYKIIAGVNSTLTKLEEGKSQEDDQLIAENLYIRSLMYFYLTNVFGRPYNQGASTNLGVPIKLKDDPYENLPRSTVKQVYDQILTDLDKAEALINDESRDKVYASKEAVYALLSRVYLYMENNQKAIEYANKVIDSGKFTLISKNEYKNFAVNAPEKNPENIFSIKFVKNIDYPDGGWYTIGSMYANINGSGWGEMYASRKYLELVRKYPQDVRYSLIKPVLDAEKPNELHAYYVKDNYQYASVVVTKSGTDYNYTESGVTKTLIKKSNGADAFQYFINIEGKERTVLVDNKLANRNGYLKYYILKCSGQEDQSHLWSPVISRLSEMYLIRAEANAKLGNTNAALTDVNVIRERAGIPTGGLWTTANLGGLSALDVVMQERQLELAWVGHRKFDVFRNGLTMERQYPGTHLSGNNPFYTIAPTANEIVEYIPEQQINLSKGVLVQNP